MSAVRVQHLVMKALRRTIGLAFNPLVVGPLLLALTRGSDATKARILEVLAKLPGGSIDAEKAVKILKVLLTVGVLGRVNAWVNVLAQNSYMVRAPTADWQWNQQIALVTGGSSGIGQCLVKGLLRKGCKVVVMDIVPLSAELKDWANIYYFKCDVTDASAVFATAAEIQQRVGTVSLLINNAGIGKSNSIIEQEPEFLQKIFGVNLFSHFYTVRAFLPGMLAQKRGHIVSIASTATFMSLPGIADYCCTKAGVLSFHESLTSEIRHKHKCPTVLTSVIHPNWTRTAIIAKEVDAIEKAQGPVMTPEFVAEETLKQIFACRGGQLILPPHMVGLSTIRSWPNWMQQGLRDGLAKQAVNAGQV